MYCTSSSTNGSTTQRRTPLEIITDATFDAGKLRLKNVRRDGEWFGFYLGTIRTQAAELELQAQLADFQTEQARTERDRAIDMMHGLYYTMKVAFQVAKIVGMDEEPDIIPASQDETGLRFIVFGDSNVNVTVYLRVDGRTFMTVRNAISGIEPVTVEISDEGLTPIAAIVVANAYFSPLSRQTTPTHLRWMWDYHTDPAIAIALDEIGIDATQFDVLVVPLRDRLLVKVTLRS